MTTATPVRVLLPMIAAWLIVGPAWADDQPQGFWTRDTLLGDMGGLRTQLGTYGITLNLQEQSEILGNVSGGLKRGAEYDGLTTATLQLDTGKAFGLDGGLFNASAFQIHGRNLSTENLATLQTASGIEANRATRLWELWYQQALWGGAVDVKVGKQSLDQEFLVSQGSSLFLNTAAGWPVLPSVDQYAGGPAYPLASPGLRVRAKPTDTLTVLGGVFNDNPLGGPFTNDGQSRDASGTRFNFNTGALLIAELQYAVNPPPADDKTPATGLAGLYKLGAWYDTGAFPDQRFDNRGRSLADPASTGVARMRRGNFSLYAVADQTIWQPDLKGAQALALFARLMGAPGDRNLVDVAVNAGVTLKAPFAGRDKDTLGLEFGVAKISDRATDFDRDSRNVGGAPAFSRSSETFIELTYQLQLAPWWQLQPDFQYVFNPGGRIPDPASPGRPLGDEAVLGMRTTILF